MSYIVAESKIMGGNKTVGGIDIEGATQIVGKINIVGGKKSWDSQDSKIAPIERNMGVSEGKVKAMKLKSSWFRTPRFPVLCIHRRSHY